MVRLLNDVTKRRERWVLHVLLTWGCAVVAIAWFGMGGALIGALLGLLAAEVLKLRRRLTDLERRQEQGIVHPKATPAEEVIFAAVEEPQPPLPRPAAVPRQRREEEKGSRVASPPSGLDRFFTTLGQGGSGLAAKLRDFFTTGNVVLKIGVIVLFFGIAFLINYASQRNLVSLELRLIAAAVAALGLLALGWRLRHTKTAYGLTLQGAGVGILYLVVFGAGKLYHMLPLELALALMVALVALSCLLAVIEDGRALAVFASIGGFLAPVLMSTGGGNHVALFSYYALINLGIFAIAWKKSWRELNLVGFFFTFAIATLWGASAYQRQHFATTEPFLVLFFLFYLIISVLFAYRQPVNLRGFIDGPLVFGLPLVVSGLQYYLVRDMDMGMALSALGLGFLYLGVTSLLWRRFRDSMHLLCEAFLALGVVFASLAIPLALDGQWSAAIWALEGAGMVWIGARQQRLLARHFGLVLQAGAALIFANSVWYPLAPLPFFNHYFLGCLFLALAAVISAYVFDFYGERLHRWERQYSLPLLVWALFWWYVAGIQEVERHVARDAQVHGLLLYSSATSILAGLICLKLPWRRAALATLPHLLLLAGLAGYEMLRFSPSSHFFSGWGATAWGIAFIIQYRTLFFCGSLWPKLLEQSWHAGTFWLLLVVVGHEAAWYVERLAGLSLAWALACWPILPSLALLILPLLADRGRWPAPPFSHLYLGVISLIPSLAMIVWFLASMKYSADPRPLVYLPLVNPLELSTILVLSTLLRCGRRGLTLFAATPSWGLHALYGLVGALLFLLMNTMVARLVHFYGGIPYTGSSLYHSAVFQAALAALWGTAALAITVTATRRGSRLLWAVGAGFLALVVVKLFAVDLSGTGTVARIVSFLVVGLLMLIIGYFSPLPPKTGEENL
jgi:uncharacterized membrane protein